LGDTQHVRIIDLIGRPARGAEHGCKHRIVERNGLGIPLAGGLPGGHSRRQRGVSPEDFRDQRVERQLTLSREERVQDEWLGARMRRLFLVIDLTDGIPTDGKECRPRLAGRDLSPQTCEVSGTDGVG
jgi:hypothetical protein